MTKNLIITLLACSLFSGCAYIRANKTTYDKDTGKRIGSETSSAFALANKSYVNGLKTHNSTKTTSSQIGVNEANTETQSELIRTIVEGTVSGAIKGVK